MLRRILRIGFIIMLKRQKLPPTLDNVLKLFSRRIDDFSGESKRSYQKAFTSFQLFVIGHYPLSDEFSQPILENWVVDNILQGLTRKTVVFYLEKLSSLYTKIGFRFTTGILPLFKEVKKKLRDLPALSSEDNSSWEMKALKAGVPANKVKAVVGTSGNGLRILELCEPLEISEEEKEELKKFVEESLRKEKKQWFAMRLRPKISFDKLIERFGRISQEVRLPELFYPSEEIARMVGRKIVWKGKPVIKDVVFFKMKKSEIYNLFTKIYDLAWCYRNPGLQTGNYAVIPNRAMDEFRNAIGFLSPDFEIAAAGELELKPGDEVVIVNGEYMKERAKILKESGASEDGNKIFRVSLLNSSGRWDIGIDARLLKKI